VTASEADYAANKVSLNTQFGNAVLGKQEKAIIGYVNPFGEKLTCQILKIEN